jgi:hypothetical protein
MSDNEFPTQKGLLSFSGVVPSLCLKAELGPPRTECAPGAMMAWADRLWVTTYVSDKSGSGVGTGFFEIDENLKMIRRPESYVGTYTNRMVHWPSNQLIIGPYVIDAKRNVRTVESLLEIRTCATMDHLLDPQHKVYVLGMEGEFFEMDMYTLETRQLYDLNEVFASGGHGLVHFKAGYSCFGRVIVASNSYYEEDYLGKQALGVLAEWDGNTWTIIERKPFVEVTGHGTFMNAIFATGWDRASAILKVFTRNDQKWTTYRLPKASHTFDHAWQTEWPRIRQTEHERFLMDCHGMFYELSPWAYGNKVWGIRPISTHLWVLGDFCTFRGMLVMGPDNASPATGTNALAGEPQSGLWFGKTDDLWQFGKPAGWGGPWWQEPVKTGVPSDPYLMTGFDKKVLHLSHEADQAVKFKIEVDFLGNGSWKTYEEIVVPAHGYVHHEFPQGFSVHWVRLTPGADCTASAYLVYT